MKYPRIWIAAHGGSRVVVGKELHYPGVPEDVLRVLARDESPDVRTRVASYRTVPMDVLELLSRDAHSVVRACVAGHPKTTGEGILTGAAPHDPQGILAWLQEWYASPDPMGPEFWREFKRKMAERGVDIPCIMRESVRKARERSEKMNRIRQVDNLDEQYTI